jgi:hypothetical protein
MVPLKDRFSEIHMRPLFRNVQKLTLASALALSCSAFAGTALANGGDFFQEFAERMTQTANIGPSYFGFVRDANGRTIPGAAVSATIMPSGSAMTVQSNVIGHYRVAGFHKNIDPSTVEISCKARGYVQISAVRRSTQRTEATPIETNCVLTTVSAETS